MATYGKAILSEIDGYLLLLNQYISDGYEEQDLKHLLSKSAATVEIFLKRDVFPGGNNRKDFIYFIDKLKDYSVDQIRIDALHTLRKDYNKAKHEPNSPISPIRVKNLIDDLQLTISDILTANIGRVNSYVKSSTKRVFWICAWDHYTNGETEVAVFLPSEYDGFLGADSIDHVSIQAIKWDEFKEDLPNFGPIYNFDGIIPNGQVEFWRSEGDCLTPFVFEGAYSDLIACLSKYLKEVDLIPGLAREDNSVNLVQTAAMAVIDVYSNDPTQKKELQCLNALSLVNDKYAVLKKFNNRIEPYIKDLVELVDKLPSERKSVLSGPIWMSKAAYTSSQSEYKNDNTLTLIDAKNRIALGFRAS